MKIIVRPILDRQRELDLTHRLVSAIAEELWRLFGGNETLNWIDADWHLQRIVAQARVEARETAVVRVAPSISDRAQNRSPQSDPRKRSAAGSSRPSQSPHPRSGVRRAKQRSIASVAIDLYPKAPQMAGAAMANA